MIKEAQKKILFDIIQKEGANRGMILHPLIISSVVEEIFSGERNLGLPLTFPLTQKPRELLDVTGYNEFIEMLGIDLNTLQSFVSRARIASRDLLVLNDVKSSQYQGRLGSLRHAIKNFHVKETATPGIFEKIFNFDFGTAEFFYNNTESKIEYDATHGMLLMESLNKLSKPVSLSFLETSEVSMTVSYDFRDIISNKNKFPFSNVSDASAKPWSRELIVRGQHTSATVTIDIMFPAIEEMNSFSWTPIPGASNRMQVFYTRAGGNYIKIDEAVTSSPHKFLFAPQKMQGIRIVQTVLPTEVTKEQTKFMFGLKTIAMTRTVYRDLGEIIISNIDPDITGRPILDVEMTPDSMVPNDTSLEYFISINGSEDIIPSTQIIEGSDEPVVFSVTKKIDTNLAYATRNFYFNKNAINFYDLELKDKNNNMIDDFDTSKKTYLPRSTELWTQQECFKETEVENFSTFEIQDARVHFGAENTAVDIHVPLTLVDSILREDSNGQYIQLPLEVAYNSIDPDTTQTAVDRMKENNFGVFEVQLYDSSDPDTFTDIRSVCSIGSDKSKIYVTGTYSLTDNFRVFCLCKLDETVTVDRFTTELHEEYGKEGVKEENQIPFHLNYYSINSKTNQIFAVKLPNGTNPIANTTRYINFTGIFYTPKFDLYETYITFNDFYQTIPFRNKLSVDQDTGEYISLRHVESGSLLKLDNATHMNGVRKGKYLLSVMSKPRRAYTSGDPPSAIQGVLETRYDPGGTQVGAFDDFYPKLFSTTSSQEFISQISALKEPLEYRETTRLLNRTRRFNDLTFSSVIENDTLKLIIPESGYNIFPIGSQEGVKLKISYFNSDLFKDNVHNKLNLRIRMRNEAAGSTSMITPSLSNVEFKVKYI